MHFLTRNIETTRYKLAAGLPLPRRLDTPHGRRFMRETYGEDCIRELDYGNPDDIYKIIPTGTDDEIRESYMKLKAVVDQQAKSIRDLERDNAQLKKQVERLKGGTT